MRTPFSRKTPLTLLLVGAPFLLTACGDYDLVDAEVVTIERSCQFNVARGPGKYSTPSDDPVADKCDATPQFARIQAQDPRSRTRVEGAAKLYVSYTPPGGTATQIGALDYDGLDDEFYVSRGDRIQIRVDRTNPADITDV